MRLLEKQLLSTSAAVLAFWAFLALSAGCKTSGSDSTIQSSAPADASNPANVGDGPADASNPANINNGPADAAAPVNAAVVKGSCTAFIEKYQNLYCVDGATNSTDPNNTQGCTGYLKNVLSRFSYPAYTPSFSATKTCAQVANTTQSLAAKTNGFINSNGFPPKGVCRCAIYNGYCMVWMNNQGVDGESRAWFTMDKKTTCSPADNFASCQCKQATCNQMVSGKAGIWSFNKNTQKFGVAECENEVVFIGIRK